MESKKPIDGIASTTADTLTAVIAAQTKNGQNVRVALTAVVFCNSSATPVLITIKCGTTARGYVYVAAGATAGVSFGQDGLLGTAGAAWNFQSSAAVSTLYATFVGHIES